MPKTNPVSNASNESTEPVAKAKRQRTKTAGLTGIRSSVQPAIHEAFTNRFKSIPGVEQSEAMEVALLMFAEATPEQLQAFGLKVEEMKRKASKWG